MSQCQQGQGQRRRSGSRKERTLSLSDGLGLNDPLWFDWLIPARYEVRSLLGSGAYGTVCEALDKDRGRMVAIKRIPHIFSDLVAAKRVLREVSILARIDDPHIVRMYDIVVPSDDLLFFKELFVVMEIGDTDLKALMQTDIEFTEAHVKWIFYNLLCGLHFLHTAGILHRDLKPSNVLVNKDCQVKICDFGLARTIGDRSEPVTLTPAVHLAESQKSHSKGFRTHGAAGTATPATSSTAGTASRRAMSKHVATRFYRAPELCLLQDDYSEAVDIWSAGCIYAELVQLLEGFRIEDRRPLFPGVTCFPLSPEPARAGDGLYHSRGRREQMNLIFDVLGTPTSAEVDQLDREDARAYLRWFAPRRGSGIRRRFPHINDDSVDILQQMLRFGPSDRITAQGALEHKLLADIRDPALETCAPEPFELEVDRRKQHEHHTEQELRQHIAREVSAIRGANPGTVGGA